MKTKRLGILASSVASIGLAAFAYHFAKFGYDLCHPSRNVVTELERQRAYDNLPQLSEVSFKAQDDVVLRGWFVPPRNGVAVVLVHGLWANRALLEPESEVLARHGYGVLLFDSRAHGESGGDAATWGSTEAFDDAEAIRFARAQPGVSRLAILGFSVGASSVTRAAANDPTVGAVILYACWTSLREEITYKSHGGGWLGAQFALLGFRISGSQVDRIEPLADLRRIAPRPILMLSGREDPDTPPWVMDRMYESASQPKELWRQPNVAHGGYFEADPTEYERRVIGFLDRAFP